MEKIRFAICGLGVIAERFLNVARSVQGTEIAACASSSKERAEAFKARHGLKYAFTYDELYESAAHTVDAVYVATNMSVHCENTVALLKNKTPVLCEKAFAQNAAETRAMSAAAKENGMLLMEAMWTRFLPSSNALIDLIKSGAAGKILRIKGAFSGDVRDKPWHRVFSKAAGGGSILDVGVYTASYTHMLLGAPEKVCAEGTVRNGVDTSCRMRLSYPDGARAELFSSVIGPDDSDMHVECENGSIRIPAFYGATEFTAEIDGGRKIYAFPKTDGFVYQIEHFISLLKDGKKESPVRPLQDTLEVMKILDESNRQLGVDFSK